MPIFSRKNNEINSKGLSIINKEAIQKGSWPQLLFIKTLRNENGSQTIFYLVVRLPGTIITVLIKWRDISEFDKIISKQ